MKRSQFLSIYAIYFVANGIASLAIPGPLLAATYPALDPSASTNLLMRFWGALAIGFGVLMWTVRKQEEHAVQRNSLTSILFVETMGFLLAVWGIVAGIGVPGLWAASGSIHLLFAVGAGYLLTTLRSGRPAVSSTGRR